MVRFALLALLLPLHSFSAPRAESEILPTRSASCQDFISKLPADFFHGWVESPEDIKDGTSRKILVFYYGRKAPNFVNPVVFHNGGPGYENHSYKRLIAALETRGTLDKLSLVLIDQRGNGCSDSFPKGEDAETIHRLRWYGSSGIVYDSELVRRKLIGNQKWKVFGQSYGAFIVHRYAALFPDSISQAYAHANAISANPQERLNERIYSQYRVWNIYFQQFPDDKRRVEILRDEAEKNVCFPIKDGTQKCGFSTTEILVGDLGFTFRWNDLHETLKRLVPESEPDKKAWGEEVSANYDDSNDSPTMTDTADRVIGVFDRNTSGYSEETCRLAFASLEAKGISTKDQLINECQSYVQEHGDIEKRRAVAKILGAESDILTLDKFRSGLERLGAGKFHLYSGERDCFVPKETIEPEAKALEGLVSYTHFPSTGHDGYFTEGQIWDELIE